MNNETDNLALWNDVEATNPDFTKDFNRGGGFKGTSINATYIAKKATSKFGPMGIGWGIDLLKEEIIDGAPGDKIHKVYIGLWYKWNGERGEVNQFGQTTFVGRNKNGPYTDEEAPKKSLTDAMTKCLSLLGFGSDIHLGLYDDNKYVRDLRRDFDRGDEFNNDERPARQDGDVKAEVKSEANDEPPFETEAKLDVQGYKDKITSLNRSEIAKFMTTKSTVDHLDTFTDKDREAIKTFGRVRMKELKDAADAEKSATA